MPSRVLKAKNAIETHTHLGIQVASFDASVEAGLNLDLVVGPPTYPGMDQPVIASGYALTISGVAHYPEERAGERYIVKLVAGANHDGDMAKRLKDIQLRDEHGALKFRTYRGIEYPVFDVPKGVGMATRLRDPQGWDVWMPVPSSVLTCMLTLLGQSRPLYLSIHEVRHGRERWIRSVGLQTIDPMIE